MNVLIFPNPKHKIVDVVAKLSDFAFSRSTGESHLSGGTEYWNAPECSRLLPRAPGQRNFSNRDYFSLGLVAWYVCFNEEPFKSLVSEMDESQSAARILLTAKCNGHLLKILRENPMDVRVLSPIYKPWLIPTRIDGLVV